MSNEPKLQELVALHAMVTRMCVLSSPRTVTCAEKIMKATVDTSGSAYHDGRPASARTQLSYRNYM